MASNGDGSITEITTKEGASYRPKRWRVRVSFGFNPVTGKRLMMERTVRGTKTQARKERDRIRQEKDGGISIETYSLTFGQYAERWHAQRVEAGEHAERTMQAEEKNINHLCRVLGAMKLRDVSPTVAEEAIRKLRNEKRGRKGVRVSGTTAHKYYQLLNQIMKAAVNMDLITRNPCDRIKPPKIDTEEKKAMTAEQLQRLHRLLDEQEAAQIGELAGKERRMEALGKRTARESVRGISGLSKLTAVRLGMATGMRLGEVLALRWCDLDKECAKLKVSQAITASGSIKEPKTRGSRRAICLDADTAGHLKRWKAAQKGALLTLGLDAVRDTPVCCSDVGGYLDMSNFESWFRRWRKASGFEEFTFHQLRHTHATQLLGAGMDIKTVSARLGHASAATTLNVYSHAIPSKDEEAANVFEGIMQPSGKNDGGTAELKAC